jgi:selenocysteine lyase/cysteine desulfurase
VTFKPLFSRFLAANPERLHFAAHSHHPWPDVTYDAHIRYWSDSALAMDDKWDSIFGELVPSLRRRLGGVLGLGEGESLSFAPNTHELVNRVFSSLEPPVRIVTTDGEFHSFRRQSLRWEEAGRAIVTRIPIEPFATFADRFVQATDGVDLAYLSQVPYDSGWVVDRLGEIVARVPTSATVIVDGYHGFMAIPTDWSALAGRAFYVAGGYKYAMAGEGACFMHCPPGVVERPIDTGWLAGFGALTERSDEIAYGPGGDRFWGATFDPSGLYRLNAVLELFEREGIPVTDVRSHVSGLQEQFLNAGRWPGELMPPVGMERGSFLTFRTSEASEIHDRLRQRQVITDYRGDRFRIGFGIYHDAEDVDRLIDAL